MRFLWSLLILSLVWSLWLVSPCFAQENYMKRHFRLEWQAAVVPPAHEPVIGNKVARYMAEIKPGLSHDNFRASLALRAWGVNTWLPPSVRGHGWEKYENSDWSVEEWRTSMTLRVEAGPSWLYVFGEYFCPFDRDSYSGHGYESNYSAYVGIGGRL